MSAEQTPDIADVLAEHDGWSANGVVLECGCGEMLRALGDWFSLDDCHEMHRAHVAAALAPVLDAAVREAEQRALREAADAWDDASEENRLYLTQLAERYRVGGPSMPAIFLRDRADRITEPVSHEAATSGEEASKA